MARIAVLTSGGDSPGMNAAVMAVARSAALVNLPILGVKRGFNGLLGRGPHYMDDFAELTLDTVLDIADLPGTYLRTARCKEFIDPEVRERAATLLRRMDVTGLVVIGGDGSFKGARALCELGIPCIGIPGTIDNDLAYTEISLGFDTAVNVCVDAVRSIRATSRSHDRAAVVEVMGRNCGDIALNTAMSTGAEIVIVPEDEGWTIENVSKRLAALVARGNTRATIVVAEGAWRTMEPFDVYGYLKDQGKRVCEGERINAYNFAQILQCMTEKAEVRATVIGYTQRGETPSARDSAFAFEAGVMAVNLLHHGVGNVVVGVKNGRTFYMPIDDALQARSRFNRRLFNMVNAM